MQVALNQLGQVSLTVTDVDRAQAFYEQTLGLRKLYRFGDLVFFDLAGVRLMVSKPQSGGTLANSVLYFRVADLALACNEFKQRGVEFVSAPHLVAPMVDHDLWMAFFKDPDGNTLALMMEAPKGYALPQGQP